MAPQFLRASSVSAGFSGNDGGWVCSSRSMIELLNWSTGVAAALSVSGGGRCVGDNGCECC